MEFWRRQAVGDIAIRLTPGGSGRLEVYLDGEKLEDTTPLINFAVPPGSHTVRVVNEALGIDASKDVAVESGGGTERVYFKVD